jgi:predicted Zn-dependent peptidase
MTGPPPAGAWSRQPPVTRQEPPAAGPRCPAARRRDVFLALAIVSTLADTKHLGADIPFTSFALENGLQVILHEDHTLPLVAVNLWYRVGSKDEPPGRSGFAHLFEHLMFMGTEKVPYPMFDVVMENAGGANNASTSTDRTNYFESGPSHLLETFLILEADRMASLGTSMTREKLDTQREVVRNERRQSYENRPYGKAYLEIPRRLYPEGHPYHQPVIGSHEDLERASVADVKDFFARFYFPANATLAVAGDFDPAAARALIARHFGPLPARPGLPRRGAVEPPPLAAETRATLVDQVELPLTILAWRSPAAYQPGDADMDVLAAILGGGKSSRLFRALVYEQKLAQEVAVHQSSKELVSEFRILAYARPEVSQDDIEAAIDRELERLREEGPTAREVERARNRIETTFWQEIETISDRADLLNAYQYHYGDPGAITRDRARYGEVTIETARHWAREVLKPERRLRLRVVPED